MTKKIIALVPGDGAGPEMMAEACRIVIAAAKLDNLEIEFIKTPMGWNAYEEFGDTMPEESFKKAVEIGTIFFGGVGDPKFDKTIGKEKPEMMPEARALLTLRKEMGLLLNFRPMIYYKSLDYLSMVKPENIPEEGVTQFWVRFLLEDSYFGNLDLRHEIPEEIKNKIGLKLKQDVSSDDEIIVDMAYYRKSTVEKYIRACFNYARELKLPLISVDKANVMARYDLWRKIVTKIGADEFPDVKLIHQLVDSANSMLFTPAKLSGVIACGNEHGDILSDGAAAALGSMGLMCSSAVNPETQAAMFESGAGTAPTLAGKDKANPLGRILTGALMLRHIGAKKGAKAIEKAVEQTLVKGYRTGDLFSAGDNPKKLLGTRAMGEKILAGI
ncbi:MAG: isocitrate/isopropylmalate family dehydrogenase [Patescibacteria group bacterium]|jgi:3-isopropylmalate dehydrogenase